MKNPLPRYYHLVLLGLASLVAAGIAAYLILQSASFSDAIARQPSHGKQSGADILASSNTLVSALEIAKTRPVWKSNTNGSSPYVSRPYLLKDGQLIDPMVSTAPPLFPPVPNKWLMDHQLDYTDMGILERDPKKKGFTVLEEFLAGTDPSDANSFPPLYTKLSYSDADIKKTTYLFEFLGEDVNDTNGRKEFKLRPLQQIPNPDKGNRPDTSVRGVIIGETVPGAQFLKVVDYVDKRKTINETEYDFSELILENTLTSERHALTKKNVTREYQRHPIQLVDSVMFHYLLTGAPQEDILVERGKDFTLGSIDRKHTENYKLVNFSSEGILLEKDGKTITVKPASSSFPGSVPLPSPNQ